MTSRVENEYTLKITETTTTHTGTVKVTAENTIGSDSKTAELKVGLSENLLLVQDIPNDFPG